MRGRRRKAGLLLATSFVAWAGAAPASETITYGYDSLGRLVRVDRTGTANPATSAAYSYDPADNRTSVTVNAAVAGGGFEAPEVGSGYSYAPGGSPASFAGNAGVAGNGSAWGFAAAPEGDQVAFLQGAAGASTISLPVTGLTPGASYAFAFRLSARPGFQPIAVTVAFNGTVLGSFTPGSNAFVATTSGAFTANAGSGTLTFSTAPGLSINLCAGLDQVGVVAAGGP